MPILKTFSERLAAFGVALFCFGYFASYIPYSMMAKLITSKDHFSGFEIQPVVVLASTLCMYAFITAIGWWKHATQFTFKGLSLPRPQWFTFISGICTAGQIITTTLAYTFEGVSIVFAMLLMRGGVLAMAPIVDLAARKRKRKIYWPSWVAAFFSFAALIVTFAGRGSTQMTVVCAVDIIVYLMVYFFRLFFMSNRAKSGCPDELKRYFTEEQMVANISLFLMLAFVGIFGAFMGEGSIPNDIWKGFVRFPFSGYFIYAFFIGVFSYGTGLFGSLIYLDKRENTFTVPANRSASVIAGVIATYLLAIFYKHSYPDIYQIFGAMLIIGSIIFLAYRQAVEKKTSIREEVICAK